MRLGGTGGGLDHFGCRVVMAERNVVCGSRGENRYILRHQRHAVAEHSRIGIAHIHPVDQHLARQRIVVAQDEREDRALAGTGRADDGDRLARRNIEGDVVERRQVRALRIGEGDRIECDPARGRNGQRRRGGGGCDRRLLVEEFADPFGGACGKRQFAPDFRKRAERAGGEDRIKQELAECAGAEFSGEHGMGAIPEHADDAAESDGDGETCQDRAGGDGAAGGTEGRIDGAGKARAGQVFCVEGLDRAGGADGLAGQRHGFCQRILRLA